MENKTPNQKSQSLAPNKRPDDSSSVSVNGFIKIFDPKTRKVFVEQKA